MSVLLSRPESERGAVIVNSEQNAILARLPPGERDSIRAQCSRVRLVQEQTLMELGSVVEHVYFMEQGIISLSANTPAGGPRLQVGMIGSEGMVGFSVLFGPGIPAMCNATVQMPGTALRIPTAMFQLWLERLPALHEACMKQLASLMAQFASNAACNGSHPLLGRCATWLLATHERSEGRDSLLTHEYMAETLGVRRSGVTVALGALKAAGVIEHGRGRIRVIDEPGLQRLSCGCFRISRRDGRIRAEPALECSDVLPRPASRSAAVRAMSGQSASPDLL